MRRISYWVLSTVALVVLLFSYHTSTSGVLGNGPSTSAVGRPFQVGTTALPTDSTTQSSRTTGARSVKRAAAPSSTHAATGAVAQTQWGPVQVQLVVDGSRIVGVKVLQYPQSNGRSVQINSAALPILTHETIGAQSAHIDMVSGATVTSGGYLQSLQSALDQAKL